MCTCAVARPKGGPQKRNTELASLYWTTEKGYWTDEFNLMRKGALNWIPRWFLSLLCIVLDKLTMYSYPYACPSIMFDHTSSFVVACVLTGCMCELVWTFRLVYNNAIKYYYINGWNKFSFVFILLCIISKKQQDVCRGNLIHAWSLTCI